MMTRSIKDQCDSLLEDLPRLSKEALLYESYPDGRVRCHLCDVVNHVREDHYPDCGTPVAGLGMSMIEPRESTADSAYSHKRRREGI
jgi:hypothetical protein